MSVGSWQLKDNSFAVCAVKSLLLNKGALQPTHKKMFFKFPPLFELTFYCEYLRCPSKSSVSI